MNKYRIRTLGTDNVKEFETDTTLWFDTDVSIEWIDIYTDGQVIITTQKPFCIIEEAGHKRIKNIS